MHPASPSAAKSSCLGVRVGLVPLYLGRGNPSSSLVSFGWFCDFLLVGLGNISRQLRVDTSLRPLSVAPVP